MSKSNSLAVIILAAGKGTRMRSAHPKVMHAIAGKPMIAWVLDSVKKLSPQTIVVVTAPGMDSVAKAVSPHKTVHQNEQLGTAHAVGCAKEALRDFSGKVLVVYGDGPLYTSETLQSFLNALENSRVPMGFLGMEPANPSGYGRLVIKDGFVSGIVEEKDATVEQKKIRHCWTGVMAADAKKLFQWLEEVSNHNAKNEYYLTQLPEIAMKDQGKTMVSMAPADEARSANSRDEMAILERHVQQKLRAVAMEGGATLLDPDTTYFSHDTQLGKDVVIEPCVFFGPGVTIADNVTIHAFSHLEGVTIESGASIGPFARIRPGSHVGENAVAGNFIELNRASLKAGAKAKHVSYLGDAVIGEKSNIGAGTVIANYDGFNKQETEIGRNVFVGSNSTIIAPRHINEGAIVGAGSVVTEDIPADALYLERSQADIRPGAGNAYRQKKGKK